MSRKQPNRLVDALRAETAWRRIEERTPGQEGRLWGPVFRANYLEGLMHAARLECLYPGRAFTIATVAGPRGGERSRLLEVLASAERDAREARRAYEAADPNGPEWEPAYERREEAQAVVWEVEDAIERERRLVVGVEHQGNRWLHHVACLASPAGRLPDERPSEYAMRASSKPEAADAVAKWAPAGERPERDVVDYREVVERALAHPGLVALEFAHGALGGDEAGAPGGEGQP